MAIRYNGMEFDTVQELVEYKKIEEGIEEDNPTVVFEPAKEKVVVVQKPVKTEVDKLLDEIEGSIATDEGVDDYNRHYSPAEEKIILDAYTNPKNKINGGRVKNHILDRLTKQTKRTRKGIIEKARVLLKALPNQPKSKSTKIVTNDILYRNTVKYIRQKGKPVRLKELTSKIDGLYYGARSCNLIERFKNSYKFDVTRDAEGYLIAEKGMQIKSKPTDDKPKVEHAGIDKTRKRMLFIRGRVKSMLALNPGMKYDEAFRRASEEYKDRGDSFKKQNHKPAAVVSDFPKIYPLADISMSVFESIIQNMIANKITLKFPEVIGQLMVRNNGQDVEITGRDWRTLCQQFMLNSGKVADYFNVANKFKHANELGYDVLRYG